MQLKTFRCWQVLILPLFFAVGGFGHAQDSGSLSINIDINSPASAQAEISEGPDLSLRLCAGLACQGLTYLAPGNDPPSARGLVTFDLMAQDALAQAFANQVIDLVSSNLSNQARVAPPVASLDALGLLVQAPSDQPLSDGAGLENQSAPPTWTIAGTIAQDGEEVVEMNLRLQSADGTNMLDQPLLIRSGVSDWRRVAHFISDTVAEEVFAESGVYDSQILFIAANTYGGQDLRRLALIDQAGGGLTWIRAAGHQVLGATFLDTPYEISYLTATAQPPRLMHLNLLTGRTTPLAVLPDLVGVPAMAAGGRLIAFAGAQTNQDAPLDTSEDPPEDRIDLDDGLEIEVDVPSAPNRGQEARQPLTDIFVVDVEQSHVQAIDLPLARDRHPRFAPSLDALAFVSEDSAIQTLMLLRLAAPLHRRDRTQGASPLTGVQGDLIDLYISDGQLHDPAWSPDGRWLAFIETINGQDDLNVLDMSTRQVRRLASGPNLRAPTWAPNSEALVVVTQAPVAGPGTLVRLDLRRGQAKILAAPFQAVDPVWGPAYRP